MRNERIRWRLASPRLNAGRFVIHRLLFDLSRHLQRLAGTHNFELNVLIQLGLRQNTSQHVDIRYVAAIELADNVASLQLRLSCGRSRHYFLDNHAFAASVALARLKPTRMDPQITADNPALLQ